MEKEGLASGTSYNHGTKQIIDPAMLIHDRASLACLDLTARMEEKWDREILEKLDPKDHSDHLDQL